MSRLCFLGTPRAAVPSLRALVDAGHQVALVVSRADARRSRRGDPEPSPVKQAALELGLPVTDDLEHVTGVGAELGIVVAYGRIIPARILEVVPMLNVHFSVLPRWRGAAPVERAILAGDETTGVSVMRLEAGLDTGPVLSTLTTEIRPDETSDELTQRLADAGAQLLVEVLLHGARRVPGGTPQAGDATYADKVDTAELELHLERPAAELARIVRIGKAWTTFRGKRLLVPAARPAPDHTVQGGPGALDGVFVATGSGALELVEVQPEGKKRMPAREWSRGAHVGADDELGS